MINTNMSQKSFKNYKQIKESKICGCYHCSNIYLPNKIQDWIDDGQTALCPYCGIDSVIGNQNGYIINKDVLEQLYTQWFKHD